MSFRRRRAWPIVLAVFCAVALCVLMLRQTRSADIQAHGELRDLLLHVRQLDSDLGKGVLASRYGLVNQYDTLTQSNAELDQSRVELRSLVNGAIPADARSERAVRQLEQAELSLHGDVELFKTQNSVLRNSLLYLPLAGETLLAKLKWQDPADTTATQAAVEGLVRTTLTYDLTRTDEIRHSLLSRRAELARAARFVPPSQALELTQFLRHAEIVVSQQELVDPLVARISSSTLSPAVARLEALADEDLDHDDANSSRHRLALTFLVIALVFALSVIGYKLKRLYESLEQQVRERTRKLADETVALQIAEHVARLNETRINAIIEGAREGIVRLASNGQVRSWNPSAADIFQAPWTEIQGKSFVQLAVAPEAQTAFLAWLSRVDGAHRIDAADYWQELPFVTATGRVFPAECSIARRDPALDNELTLFVRDISQAKQLETELRQAQKLESVGRLASGIAHEINTPIQFVSDSCFFIKEAFDAMARLVQGYATLLGQAASGDARQGLLDQAAALEEEADLSYVLTSAPKSIETMVDGLSRVAELVAGMKTFAHPDQREKVLVDLNLALKSTLTIARNEYKYVADVETDLAELPLVVCHGGEINQVILNILVNAAHAIDERVKGTEQRGLIVVRTRADADSVVVSISDTGSGIPAEIRGRIFDPFFTTKDVGRGTGQGLAIARSVIVEQHGGELSFDTELGKGTTFHVRLPINGRAREARSAA